MYLKNLNNVLTLVNMYLLNVNQCLNNRGMKLLHFVVTSCKVKFYFKCLLPGRLQVTKRSCLGYHKLYVRWVCRTNSLFSSSWNPTIHVQPSGCKRLENCPCCSGWTCKYSTGKNTQLFISYM